LFSPLDELDYLHVGKMLNTGYPWWSCDMAWETGRNASFWLG